MTGCNARPRAEWCGLVAILLLAAGCGGGDTHEPSPAAVPLTTDAIDQENVWFTAETDLSAPSAIGLDRLLGMLLEMPDLWPEIVCGRPMEPIDLRKLTVYQCGLVLRYLTSRGVERDRIGYRLVTSPPGPVITVALRPLASRVDPGMPPDGSEDLPEKRTLF